MIDRLIGRQYNYVKQRKCSLRICPKTLRNQEIYEDGSSGNMITLCEYLACLLISMNVLVIKKFFKKDRIHDCSHGDLVVNFSMTL